MTLEELKKATDSLKDKGLTDEDIIVSYGEMFEDGKITKNQLVGLCEALGYEMDKDWLAKSEEEARKSLWKTNPDEKKEGLETKESEEVEELGDKEPQEVEKKEPKEKEKGDDEDEKKEALKLFGL